MKQPVQTLRALFGAAEAAHTVFTWVLVEIAEQLSLPVLIATSKGEQEAHKHAPVQCELYVDILKSRERAQQKADNELSRPFEILSGGNTPQTQTWTPL
jgi:hypothetical protein